MIKNCPLSAKEKLRVKLRGICRLTDNLLNILHVECMSCRFSKIKSVLTRTPTIDVSYNGQITKIPGFTKDIEVEYYDD